MNIFRVPIDTTDLQNDTITSLDAKDSNYISNRTYSSLRKSLDHIKGLPSLYSIRKMEHSQNKLVVNSNQKGVFVSIREKLRIYIAVLHKNKKLNLIENNTITIKFCGDGTNLTKKSSIYNFCFSIIDQKKLAKRHLAII